MRRGEKKFKFSINEVNAQGTNETTHQLPWLPIHWLLYTNANSESNSFMSHTDNSEDSLTVLLFI